MTDWMLEREARLAYSYERFAQSKVFVRAKFLSTANGANKPPSVALCALMICPARVNSAVYL